MLGGRAAKGGKELDALPRGSHPSRRAVLHPHPPRRAPVQQYRTERNGILHAAIGRVSFEQEQLEENLRAFMLAVSQAKPSGATGKYILGVSVSSTMGPGIAIEAGKADPTSALFFREEP